MTGKVIDFESKKTIPPDDPPEDPSEVTPTMALKRLAKRLSKKNIKAEKMVLIITWTDDDGFENSEVIHAGCNQWEAMGLADHAKYRSMDQEVVEEGDPLDGG